MQEALVVSRETHISAPPAAVFALLTDPEKILRWMGTEAQVEPQPGGLYLVNVTGARFARGSFREVVVARVKSKGLVLAQVLGPFVEQALTSLPIPKMMRWGARVPETEKDTLVDYLLSRTSRR